MGVPSRVVGTRRSTDTSCLFSTLTSFSTHALSSLHYEQLAVLTLVLLFFSSWLYRANDVYHCLPVRRRVGSREKLEFWSWGSWGVCVAFRLLYHSSLSLTIVASPCRRCRQICLSPSLLNWLIAYLLHTLLAGQADNDDYPFPSLFLFFELTITSYFFITRWMSRS